MSAGRRRSMLPFGEVKLSFNRSDHIIIYKGYTNIKILLNLIGLR